MDDPELVDLLLRRGLTPHLVSTPVYMIISQVVIKAHETDGDEVLPHLMLDTVVGQLCEAGLQVCLGDYDPLCVARLQVYHISR